MKNVIHKMIGDKKEYRRQMERVKALPEEYQFVFHKMQDYMWGFIGGTGLDMMQTQYELIELFESGAAAKQHVLDITGEDVAAFCDELICDHKLWTDGCRNRLNRKLYRKLK